MSPRDARRTPAPATPALTTGAPAPTRAGTRQWAALVVLMLPVLLVSVDNTVLSFALPEISTALQPSAAAQLWIVDVYSLVLAGLLVAMGSLGDRFGRRRLLLVGASGFAAVSVVAAFAPTGQAIALDILSAIWNRSSFHVTQHDAFKRRLQPGIACQLPVVSSALLVCAVEDRTGTCRPRRDQ